MSVSKSIIPLLFHIRTINNTTMVVSIAVVMKIIPAKTIDTPIAIASVFCDPQPTCKKTDLLAVTVTSKYYYRFSTVKQHEVQSTPLLK